MQNELEVSRVLPPRPDDGDLKTTSMRIPEKLLERLDRIASDSGYSRNEVMIHFLRWAMQEHEIEAAEKKTAKR